mgnify:CR=1 FL=1
MTDFYKNLMNSINSEKERNAKMMGALRIEDKAAILQLVCQLIISADGGMIEEKGRLCGRLCSERVRI